MFQTLQFTGQGHLHNPPWYHSETEPPITDDQDHHYADRHPKHYIADPGLVAAVNTALLLHKPLLVTGSPGTGKSDLAERIAWEFELGPVLRFEAQSLSEANDLFYRFDLVGRLAASRLQADRFQSGRQESDTEDKTDPQHFVEFGPFGKAILRATPHPADDKSLPFLLRRRAFPSGETATPQRSVVLIDEIDKASRDFPNDLLNGIERMEFRIRELDNLLIQAPDKAQGLRPIVIITSNQERDLPAPFLRRCAFYHIPDPDQNRLADIVRARVFPERDDLPPFYQDLLKFFVDFRDKHKNSHIYSPGTTEIQDTARALVDSGADQTANVVTNQNLVRNTLSAIAKHRDDLDRLEIALQAWPRAPH